MSKDLVSVIIVNWNGGQIFEDCLKSLSRVKYTNWELIVVDNGSTDGSEEIAKKYFKNSILVQNKENVGFAKANNQGLEKCKGEYILLLNNDTKVQPDLLDVLVERLLNDEKLGVIQPKIKIMDNPSLLDNCGSYLTGTGFLQHWGFLKKDSKEFSEERIIFSAKGACMLIRREVVEKVGLFDSDYGSYFEETDFCWRAWLAGYKILYYPRTYILHKVGFTSKRQNQIFVNYHSFKNRFATIIKNTSFWEFVRVGIPHVLILIVLGVYYLIRLRFRESAIVWKSLWWNISHIGSLLIKRGKVGKFRKISTNELFEDIYIPINLTEMFHHFIRSERVFAGKHEV